MLDSPDPKSFTRVEGLLVRSRSKSDLYFRQDCSFTYTIMYTRLLEHTMVCNVEYFPATQEGQCKTDAHGICKFFDDDHLSPGEIGVRTNSNLGVKAGYTLF